MKLKKRQLFLKINKDKLIFLTQTIKKSPKNFPFYCYCFHEVSVEKDEKKPRNSGKKMKIQKF